MLLHIKIGIILECKKKIYRIMIKKFEKFNILNESKIAEAIQDFIGMWYSDENKNVAVTGIYNLVNIEKNIIIDALENSDEENAMEVLMEL
jgi:hypothetical protein